MDEKIKAVLVEAVQDDRKVIVDGKETVREGERRRYWYHQTDYPKDVLDCGDFYEVSLDSSLWPTTPDDVEVHCDAGTLNDFLDIRGIDVAELIGEALDLNDGEWIERYSDGWRVRVTARGELPPLSAERTVANSDLTKAAKARIRINGKPLYLPGTMERGTRMWFPDLSTFVHDAVVTAVQAMGGNMAKVSLNDDPLIVRNGGTGLGISFRIEAKTFEDLVTFLRNVGVANPETVHVVRKTGDGDGVKSFRAVLLCTDAIEG